MLLHSRSTFSSATDTVKLTARANVLTTQRGGSYDATMTITATANP